IAGEPPRSRKSPSMVGASPESTEVTNSGSASMLPPPSITPLPFQPPCTRLWAMVVMVPLLAITLPEPPVLLSHKMTLRNVGPCSPEVLPLAMAPPTTSAQLPAKVTLVSIGLLLPRLYIAPPSFAELPLKVALVTDGLLLPDGNDTLVIAPPKSGVQLPENVTLVNVGLLSPFVPLLVIAPPKF